jgi:FKBP-type peptidyl-prolyl cis-trans isomerase
MLMPVGAKYHVTIPPALGYGDRGVGSRIGPNQALVFEIELIGIEPDHPAASGPVSSGRGGL